MSQIVIGKTAGGAVLKRNVALNLDVLIRTRLLIQANSGKGKSWLLRRLAEQLFGKVQVIIIDPEGEFASLREKLGFVLVGKGGETPADPRSAALVARKLLELRASAVCDIYELKPAQRHAWVKAFLESMIDAPKNLWHPVIVVIDEAHVYCPEKGAGESEASESVIGMATRGRKRGYCLVAATQRLGKFRKDAAAEMLNVMIGGTFIDIDRKRAADALGVYGKDTHAFFDEIKLLERGNFYALGPAISNERVLIAVGPIETTHPEAGSAKHAAEPPPAPEAIAKLLPKLSDLPKEAEEKAKTETELRREIRELKAQVRSAAVPKVQPTAAKPAVDERAIARAVKQHDEKWRRHYFKVSGLLLKVDSKLRDISGRVAETVRMLEPLPTVPEIDKVSGGEIHRKGNVQTTSEPPAALVPRPATTHHPRPEKDIPLKAGARRMLQILAQWHPEPKTRDELGALAGFAASGGTFGDYLSKLRLCGFITENGRGLSITDDGLANVGDIPPRPDSTEQLVSMWKGKFKAGVGRMLDVLVEAHPEMITREELGERSGFTYDGGTFGDYLSQLRRARLIEESGNQVKAAESLFP